MKPDGRGLHVVEPYWSAMDARPRIVVRRLAEADLPVAAGAYAFYRDGVRIYVGKAGSLRARVWGNHCGRGVVLTGSALRRNVAEHLGIASAADIKARRRILTSEEAVRVRAWLDDCQLAWIITSSETAALELEVHLKREHRPPLTQR